MSTDPEPPVTCRHNKCEAVPKTAGTFGGLLRPFFTQRDRLVSESIRWTVRHQASAGTTLVFQDSPFPADTALVGIFQQASKPETANVTDANQIDDKLRLLSRLPSVVFDQTFRGLDPLGVDRLFDHIARHEPNLRAGLEHRRIHGEWPTDGDFSNSINVLESATSEGIPSAFRGCDPVQVERVLEAIRELPAYISRD